MRRTVIAAGLAAGIAAPAAAQGLPGLTGIDHIGFTVPDLDAAVAYLEGKGVKVLGAPTPMTEGPSAGETWVYFLAPWGMQLELVSYPDGKAYETDFATRLWDPRPTN